jgi:glycosyltransferase involved in cell wall biosynthesis
MHILFLTLAYPISSQNFYTDMVDELVNQGHSVTVCVQDETRSSGPFYVSYRRNIVIISIPTGRVTKTSILKKGINTLLLEYRFMKKFTQFEFSSLDILLYSTPPITFQRVIEKLKKRYNCITYLILKDIFPQNAVDLGMIKKNSFLYKIFRYKEKKLYQHSDIIGCLSPANVTYLVSNNCELLNKQITITPNCIIPNEQKINLNKERILKDYNIPFDTIKLIYGGNIGKPQGIDFIIQCINVIKSYEKISLTIIGNGTEFGKLRKTIASDDKRIKLIDYLPTKQYFELLACMDIGLVFLDHRFTIPNFPSRILDYMNYSLPIIACTDSVCDVKQEICDHGAGFWCRSDDIKGFKNILDRIVDNKDIGIEMGKRSRELLIENYTVQMVIKDMLNNINNFRKK